MTAASLARESVLSFLIPAEMAGRRANKRPEKSSSSGEPEWRISGRQHMVESHGLTVTRTTEDFEESTIAMTATAMVGDQQGSDILLVPAQEVQQKKKAEAKEKAKEAARRWLEKRAAKPKEVITVPGEAAKATEETAKTTEEAKKTTEEAPNVPETIEEMEDRKRARRAALEEALWAKEAEEAKTKKEAEKTPDPVVKKMPQAPVVKEKPANLKGEADAKGVCWATGGGQGPSEVAGPARYPRAGGHSSEDAVCQAEGEEEARVSDACREQCAEEGPREGPGLTREDLR